MGILTAITALWQVIIILAQLIFIGMLAMVVVGIALIFVVSAVAVAKLVKENSRQKKTKEE